MDYSFTSQIRGSTTRCGVRLDSGISSGSVSHLQDHVGYNFPAQIQIFLGCPQVDYSASQIQGLVSL